MYSAYLPIVRRDTIHLAFVSSKKKIKQTTFKVIQELLNSNIGVLNVFLFILTLAIGWISGIFKSIVKRPRFKVKVIPKMTFGSFFYAGEKYTPPGQGTYDVQKVAFAIYLEITNIGNMPASLGKIEVGYLKSELSKWWHKLCRQRVYVKESNILERFRIDAGENAIGIPHLSQSDYELNEKYDGFLEVGKSIIGVAYFEQPPSWGHHIPDISNDNTTEIKIVVKDAFGYKYKKKAKILMIEWKDALRLNPAIGLTEIIITQSANQDPNELKEENEKLKIKEKTEANND